jgi:hypothetical protein
VEFDVEALRARWLSLFVDVALPAYERWRARRARGRLARFVPFVIALSAQKIEAKRFRARERREKRRGLQRFAAD